MSILEIAVHYLDSKRLQKLTEFISSSRPHVAIPSALVILLYRRGKSLCGRNDVGETAPLIRSRIAARRVSNQ